MEKLRFSMDVVLGVVGRTTRFMVDFVDFTGKGVVSCVVQRGKKICALKKNAPVGAAKWGEVMLIHGMINYPMAGVYEQEKRAFCKGFDSADERPPGSLTRDFLIEETELL